MPRSRRRPPRSPLPPGRPRLPEEKRRARRLDLSLSAAELATLEERAKAAGLPLRVYVRRVALDGRIVTVPAVNAEQVRELRSSNVLINQAMKLAHRGVLPRELVNRLVALEIAIRRYHRVLIGLPPETERPS